MHSPIAHGLGQRVGPKPQGNRMDFSLPKNRTTIVWLIAAVVALVAIGALLRPKATLVEMAVIRPQQALKTILANGKIAGSRVVALSFQRAGLVARVVAREGSVLEAGDTIVVLDNQEERNAVLQRRNALETARLTLQKLGGTDSVQTEASLVQAQAAEEQAHATYQRLSTLLTQGAAAQADVDKSKNDLDVAVSRTRSASAALDALRTTGRALSQVQVSQAQAALDESLIALGRTVIRAPEDGRVVSRAVNGGESVLPGSLVVSYLPGDTTTHVEILVDEGEVAGVQAGQKALVGIPSMPSKAFDATVRDILPAIDASRGTATVQLTMDQPPDGLLPDQTVSAQIITGSIDNALIVEQRFITFAKSGDAVFALVGRKAVRRAVTVTDLGNGRFMANTGLNVGDTVVVAPGLKDGMRVRGK